MLGEVYVLFIVWLGYVGLCGGLLCVGLCMWIVGVAMFKHSVQFGFGWVIGQKMFFSGFPCIGAYMNSSVCVICVFNTHLAFYKWFDNL